MNKKAKTINLQGQDYAKVAERIRIFREESPRGSIITFPTIDENGQILVRAEVLKDKADQHSASATAHALGTNTGQKALEKVESIAVGRALAMLGYLASGEIASGEEMMEFLGYQQEKLEVFAEELQSISTIEELKSYYEKNKGKGSEFDRLVVERKKQLINIPKNENQ